MGLSWAGKDKLHTQLSSHSLPTEHVRPSSRRRATLSFLATMTDCLVVLFRSPMHISRVMSWRWCCWVMQYSLQPFREQRKRFILVVWSVAYRQMLILSKQILNLNKYVQVQRQLGALLLILCCNDWYPPREGVLAAGGRCNQISSDNKDKQSKYWNLPSNTLLNSQMKYCYCHYQKT